MKNILSIVIVAALLVACDSKPIPFVEETHSNGTPKLVRYYKSEKKEVLLKETQYYPDSAKYIEGSFKDGLRDGIWTAWYQDGTIWSTGNYKEGQEFGKKTTYHKNGKKYYEGVIKNGKREGTWTFWDESGEIIKTIDYDSK